MAQQLCHAASARRCVSSACHPPTAAAPVVALPLPSPLRLLQFPKLYEAAAIRLVQHSVDTAEQLCGSILAHLGTHFVLVGVHACCALLCSSCVMNASDGCAHAATPPTIACPLVCPLLNTCPAACVPAQGEELVGTREDGSSTARCVVREVQEPPRQPRNSAAAAAATHKANGAAAAAAGGEESDATEEEDAAGAAAGEDEESGEEEPVDPDAIVYVVEWLGEGGMPGGERASLRRSQLQRAEGSPLAALTGPFLQLWVETVATAEPVAVRWVGCPLKCCPCFSASRCRSW